MLDVTVGDDVLERAKVLCLKVVVAAYVAIGVPVDGLQVVDVAGVCDQLFVDATVGDEVLESAKVPRLEWS